MTTHENIAYSFMNLCEMIYSGGIGSLPSTWTIIDAFKYICDLQKPIKSPHSEMQWITPTKIKFLLEQIDGVDHNGAECYYLVKCENDTNSFLMFMKIYQGGTPPHDSHNILSIYARTLYELIAALSENDLTLFPCCNDCLKNKLVNPCVDCSEEISRWN